MQQVAISSEPAVVPNPGGQAGFANDWIHQIIGLEGGWYSGKTWVGARKLIQLHEMNAFDKRGRPTYVLSFIVAPTYGNASDFCVPEIYSCLEECNLGYEYKGSGSIAGGKYAAPAIIIPEFGTRKDPSCILVRSADIPKRITGFTAGAAWGDEPARWKSDPFDPMNDPYIQMLGRVRGEARFKQIIFTYTNEGDVTQIYDQFHDGNESKKLYRAATRTNPHAKDFEKLQRDILTEELQAQYLDGTAISLKGGKVYGKFDFDLHVKTDLRIREDMPLQLSVDFNIVPGMHMELGQYHGDADIFTELYEIYGPRLTVQGAIEQLVVLLRELKYPFSAAKPLEIYGDATGGSEWIGTGQSNYFIIQQSLKDQGIPYRIKVPKANPPVQDRINAVNCSLFDGQGDIHYYIAPRCRKLIDDLKKMQRDKYGEISTLDKKLSHASSAIGYKIWWVRPVRVERSKIGGRFGV